MLPISSEVALGQVLRRFRKEQGLTQIEAGRKFNIPQKTVSRLETGRHVSLDTLFKYMAALGLEMHLEPRVKGVKDEAPW